VSGELRFKQRSSAFLTNVAAASSMMWSEAEEEEQIRIFCGQLSDEWRRKLYWHLHALGCRI
jgi:hypothetical protein